MSESIERLAREARKRIVAVLSTQHPEIDWPLDTITAIIEEVLRGSDLYTRGYEAAIAVLRGNLCAPYVAGSCEECDTRMRDIERLQAAALTPSTVKGETK